MWWMISNVQNIFTLYYIWNFTRVLIYDFYLSLSLCLCLFRPLQLKLTFVVSSVCQLFLLKLQKQNLQQPNCTFIFEILVNFQFQQFNSFRFHSVKSSNCVGSFGFSWNSHLYMWFEYYTVDVGFWCKLELASISL